MKIYFDYQTNEQPGHPPLAIDVAKALIEISLDSANYFGGDEMGPSDWLDEIGEHLHAHVRTMRAHNIRRYRRLKNGD